MSIMQDIFREQFPTHKGEVGLIDQDGNPIEDLGIEEPQLCDDYECPVKRSLDNLEEMNRELKEVVLPKVDNDLQGADTAIRNLSVTTELEQVVGELESQGLESHATEVRNIIDNIANSPMGAFGIGNESFFKSVGNAFKVLWDSIIAFIKGVIKFITGWFKKNEAATEKLTKATEGATYLKSKEESAKKNSFVLVDSGLNVSLGLRKDASATEAISRIEDITSSLFDHSHFYNSFITSYNGYIYESVYRLVRDTTRDYKNDTLSTLKPNIDKYYSELSLLKDKLIIKDEGWSSLDVLGKRDILNKSNTELRPGSTYIISPNGNNNLAPFGVTLVAEASTDNPLKFTTTIKRSGEYSDETVSYTSANIIALRGAIKGLSQAYNRFEKGVMSTMAGPLFDLNRDFDTATDDVVRTNQIATIMSKQVNTKSMRNIFEVCNIVVGNRDSGNPKGTFPVQWSIGQGSDELTDLMSEISAGKYGKDLLDLKWELIEPKYGTVEVLDLMVSTYENTYRSIHESHMTSFQRLIKLLSVDFIEDYKAITAELPRAISLVLSESTSLITAINLHLSKEYENE